MLHLGKRINCDEGEYIEHVDHSRIEKKHKQ